MTDDDEPVTRAEFAELRGDLEQLLELVRASAKPVDNRSPRDDGPRSNAERQRAYRARKRNAARNAEPDRVTDRVTEFENSGGATDRVTGNPEGVSPVTTSGPLRRAVTRNDPDSVTRNGATPHDYTGPVARCPVCRFPLADIHGARVCLECEQRENAAPPSTDETATYWHERLAETVRNAIPTTDAASLEARSRRLGLE